MVRAALAAADPNALGDIKGLTRLERESLLAEKELSFWGQMKDLTKEFRQILATCCIAAIVQGWDQSSVRASSQSLLACMLIVQQINGANLKWPTEFGLHFDLTQPEVNSREVWIFSMFGSGVPRSICLRRCRYNQCC